MLISQYFIQNFSDLMKFYYQALLITLVFPALLLAYDSKHTDAPVLLATPKAQSLRDHFGVSKSREQYGPPPSINLNNFVIKNDDNSWTKVPNPALANEIVTPDGKRCDITRHAYYDICYAAANCQQCAAIESCGNI